MERSNETQTFETTISVTFRKQGGRWVTGTAIGRKGAQLLIAYTIDDGSPRERWIPAKRWRDLQGNIDDLPRYKTQTCPATTYPEGMTDEEKSAAQNCQICGQRHNYRNGAGADYWISPGNASLKLGVVLVSKEGK